MLEIKKLSFDIRSYKVKNLDTPPFEEYKITPEVLEFVKLQKESWKHNFLISSYKEENAEFFVALLPIGEDIADFYKEYCYE